MPWDDVVRQDPRFAETAWWHGPTTHVWLSPVGEGLGEIAARSWQDPETHSADKVSWGVPVGNAYVQSHFEVYAHFHINGYPCSPSRRSTSRRYEK